jgi:O-antigen/teichoic acid export membrane protein
LLASLVALAVTALLAAAMALLEATPLASSRVLGLDGLLWLTPAGVLLYALTQPFTYWSLRQGRFWLNSMSQVAQSVCQIALQLALGFLGLGALGLGLGHVAGFVPRLVWRMGAAQDGFWSGLRRGDLAALPAVARRHRRYLFLAAPSLLLRLTAQFLPTILVTALYGPTVGGFFGLGQRVLTSPVRMVGQATSQAFVSEAVQRGRAGLHGLFVRTTWRFFLLGLCWALPLLVAAPWLFAVVFGAGWRVAGEMAQVLVPLQLARFVAVPVSQVLNLLHRDDLDLLLSVVITMAVCTSFAAGAILGLAPSTTISLYSAGSTLGFLLLVAAAWRMVRARAEAAAAPR